LVQDGITTSQLRSSPFDEKKNNQGENELVRQIDVERKMRQT